MIRTPLSTVVGGAFCTPEATVVGGTRPSFETVMKKLFANSEQGFWYDPNDLSTMFQDSAGTVPVTAVGQPVGLMLDKSKDLVLGSELFTGFNNNLNSSRSSNNTPCLVTSTASSGAFGVSQIGFIGIKTYRISVAWSGNTNNAVLYMQVGGTYVTLGWATSGTLTFTVPVTSAGSVTIYKASSAIGQTFTIGSLSVKELSGNHSYQTTSSMRPILQNTPRRIDFDAVDDKLITNLPTQLTGCTVIRSIPSVGTQILTNQTIPTTYNDNTDHCGLIVINRALTASETSAITSEFNKRAGV